MITKGREDLSMKAEMPQECSLYLTLSISNIVFPGNRIFSKDQDVVKRRDAVHDVMGHTSTSVHFHKIVLSPGQDEPVSNWREWTRQVMHDLEAAQGKQLHWYAVFTARLSIPMFMSLSQVLATTRRKAARNPSNSVQKIMT